MRDMLNSDRRLSIRILTDECNIPKSTVHRIGNDDLGMWKIFAKKLELQSGRRRMDLLQESVVASTAQKSRNGSPEAVLIRNKK
ncbi:hypothetical protein NPIL_25551 [Nephila pilipes]|uniref:Uncharacterized protein n=1 Tax=Nephila pilipes TaxID=299642 RepID=A0A8X6QZC2_NEPPI|nr:hypothetical protein NPIL_25551 [Nephila pilipes]